MNCCTTAGCRTGMHGPMPLGQPHEIQVSPLVTYYVAPIYRIGPMGELIRMPLEQATIDRLLNPKPVEFNINLNINLKVNLDAASPE